ncbi:MAG: hypothetical protein AAB673_03045, partial [Patescibacteria group bacterium]
QDLTIGQLTTLVQKLGGPAVVKDILSNKLKVRVEATAVNSATDSTLAAWATFYHDYLGLDVDISSVVIPPPQPGFDRVLVIPQGLTPNQVVAAMKKRFSVYTYVNDLDRDVTVNERDPKAGSYAIRVRNRVEADEEFKNLSADQVKQLGLTTLTLLERLVYELKYYSETQSHLDISSVTRCDGSRRSGGSVPCVYWFDDELFVYWFSSGYSSGGIRARSAVR